VKFTPGLRQFFGIIEMSECSQVHNTADDLKALAFWVPSFTLQVSVRSWAHGTF